MKLNEFNKLIGQDSYVRCIGKKRIDSSIVNEEQASIHLFNGGQIGWWVRDGYVIVDIDEGKEEALKIVKKLKLKTLMCKTPKGLHLYFKSQKEFPQKVGMILPFGLKCDFRCANKGYVLLPFGEPDRAFNNYHQISELPRIFTPLINRKDSLLNLKEGDGRNSTLFAHLMAFKNRGASDSEISEVAELINTYVFKEPMDKKELEQIVKNTQKYEAKAEFENPYIIYTEKGKPSQINSRAICDYFVNEGNMFVIGSECYQYHNGVYIESSSFVRNTIKNMVVYDNLITYSKIMEAYKLLCDDTRIQRRANEVNADKNLINFKNGIWDIEQAKLIPHDSKYLQTIQIPHEVKEFVPFTQTRLYEFFKKTKLPKEDIKMIVKYMAYSLTTDYGLKTFMVLVGQSNTGKSVLIRFFETLIGKQNISALSMHDLNARFYPSQLYGKLLNACADNKTLPLSSIENLKKITGGDQIMHEKKGKEPFFFTSFAKLIFSFNQLPLQLEEKSNAFYKRMRVLFMNNELFLNNEYVDNLCSEESVEEIIPYLLSLLPIKEIPRTTLSNSCVESLRQDSDSIHAFLSSCCENDKKGTVGKDELYQDYVNFCLQNGREAHKKHAFMRNLRSLGYKETRDKDRQAAWKGLQFKNKEDKNIGLEDN
jgi:P4 family phage/plasmid primase-like protien